MEKKQVELFLKEKESLLSERLGIFLDEKKSAGEIDVFNTDLTSEITAAEKIKNQLMNVIKGALLLTKEELEVGVIYEEGLTVDDETEATPEEVAEIARKQMEK